MVCFVKIIIIDRAIFYKLTKDFKRMIQYCQKFTRFYFHFCFLCCGQIESSSILVRQCLVFELPHIVLRVQKYFPLAKLKLGCNHRSNIVNGLYLTLQLFITFFFLFSVLLYAVSKILFHTIIFFLPLIVVDNW